MLTFFEKKGIDIKNVTGQCYDGAPNMKSEKVGVSTVIPDKSPKACVTHCWSHNLHLSIARCTNIEVINNIIEQYRILQIYIQTSSKRKSLLEHIVSLRTHDVRQ